MGFLWVLDIDCGGEEINKEGGAGEKRRAIRREGMKNETPNQDWEYGYPWTMWYF
jgi:hypothetical protein